MKKRERDSTVALSGKNLKLAPLRIEFVDALL